MPVQLPLEKAESHIFMDIYQGAKEVYQMLSVSGNELKDECIKLKKKNPTVLVEFLLNHIRHAHWLTGE